MTTQNGRKRGRTRTKQGYLEGCEPESIPALDDAASNYDEAMRDRVALSQEEDEKKDALIDLMTEHGKDRYETPDGLVVTVTNKKNIRVKHKKAAEESNGDDNE